VLSSKGISVVIPNYNGIDLLADILPYLIIALDHSKENYEIIISDDCSTDDSLHFLENNYPGIILIKNPINKGFSPTINRGIFAAQFDYVLLLNSDVKLTPHYFEPLLRYFDKEDTFGVMGRIVGWDNEKIQDAAKYPSFYGAKIKTSGNYYASKPQKDDWLYSMYLSGANALVDKNKLWALGGFDELFAPFYVEDFELSLRAWRLGWKCYYDHFAICRHKTSISIKSKSSKNFVNTIYYRNKMFLHAIHLTGAQLLAWYLQLIPEILIRVCTLRFYYLKSLKMFFIKTSERKKSERKFLSLANQGHSLLSVQQVVKKIQASIHDRSIERF
jgi:GT2 family glycosyltransferase